MAASSGSTLGKGHRLETQTKEAICNVYDYFQQLHQKGQSMGPLKRTAENYREECEEDIKKESMDFSPQVSGIKFHEKR